MFKADYHMHSDFSLDSSAKMENMVLKAIDLGLEEIAITDHLDFTYPNCEYFLDLPEYMGNITRLQAKYAGQISILKGIEMSLRPDSAAYAKLVAKEYDFDFIIGSTHDVKGVDWHYAEHYQGVSKIDAYNAYFENMLDCLQDNRDFDIVGHLDYVCRYGRYADKSLNYNDNKNIIEEILKKIIKLEKGIEINTSGYARSLGHFHPKTEIIQLYLNLGGNIITIGSDAHSENRIASEFNTAYELLKSLGVKHVARYKKRKLYFVAL